MIRQYLARYVNQSVPVVILVVQDDVDLEFIRECDQLMMTGPLSIFTYAFWVDAKGVEMFFTFCANDASDRLPQVPLLLFQYIGVQWCPRIFQEMQSYTQSFK